MRDGDAIDRDYMSPEANVLRSALEDMPRVDTAKTPMAFRDIGVSDEGLRGSVERYKPGAVVEEPAFTSASKDIPPPDFLDHGPDKPNKVRFVIDEPANARDLSELNPKELEVLWQDRNRFLVQSAKPVGDMLEVHLRDLGRGS